MNAQKKLKIFLVDNDPVCRQAYAVHLKSMGITDIEEFGDGIQCVNSLQHKPDVVLLDHEMTPVNGLETLQKIKKFDRNIFVVYLSDQGKMQITLNAMKYGAFDCVVKGDTAEKQKISDVLMKIEDWL